MQTDAGFQFVFNPYCDFLISVLETICGMSFVRFFNKNNRLLDIAWKAQDNTGGTSERNEKEPEKEFLDYLESCQISHSDTINTIFIPKQFINWVSSQETLCRCDNVFKNKRTTFGKPFADFVAHFIVRWFIGRSIEFM